MNRPQYAAWIEREARRLREGAGVGPYDRLDPVFLAEKLSIRVVSIDEFLHIVPQPIQDVLGAHSECWDGGTLVFPGGEALIIYNPARDARRRNATLMEELAHLHLNHQASSFITIGGVVLRSCNKSNERQAYAVGAAALLPSYLLQAACANGHCKTSVADYHLVSKELVTFRENVTGIRLPLSSPLAIVGA